jgi:hypothetical protein
MVIQQFGCITPARLIINDQVVQECDATAVSLKSQRLATPKFILIIAI